MLSSVGIKKLDPVGDDFGEELQPGSQVVARHNGSRYTAVIESLEETKTVWHFSVLTYVEPSNLVTFARL